MGIRDDPSVTSQKDQKAKKRTSSMSLAISGAGKGVKKVLDWS